MTIRASPLRTALRGHPVAHDDAPGSYIDVDTLSTATSLRPLRQGRYTDGDTGACPRPDDTGAPGTYVDVETRSGRVPGSGRPGKYTDVDSAAH
jgi:hypothetical protein